MGFAQRRPDWSLPQLELESLQLHPFDALQKGTTLGRQPCPNCQRSRFLFCFNCLLPFTDHPSVVLPFKLLIITHAAEKLSKNTGIHAALLCPGQVQLSSIEELPVLDASRCAVMYPSDDALMPDELDLQQLEHVIIIDSAWRKARELNQHAALEGMKRVRHEPGGQVRLPGSPRSCFWRYHTREVSDEGVCTIEALHLLLRAMAGQLPQDPYQGNAHYFDNLLWYFAYQHQRVQRAAAERQERSGPAQQRVLQNELMKKRKRGQLTQGQQQLQQQQQRQQGQFGQHEQQDQQQGQLSQKRKGAEEKEQQEQNQEQGATQGSEQE